MGGIDLKPINLPYDLEVKTPTGNQSLIANLVYRDCEIWVGERKLLADLIGLAIKWYDVILGMDWLTRYNAQINCKTKIVELCIQGEATLKLDVRDRLASSALISGIRVRKMLSKGAQGYLDFLINTLSDKVNLENMHVVKEYPDVFSEELESLPPKREITFKIDVTLGVAPISTTPYRMAPAELKELKLQLQDLLERDFIKESDSPWGALKYHPDPSHILHPENVEIDETLTYEKKSVKLLDRKVKEQADSIGESSLEEPWTRGSNLRS
ncbi:uncharacterized protein [Coffea arabica]|uniref:Uncharacterized protein n=1 Tax=Coffea arabica TaxID=13443 RepID=A0ABM4UY67_COFAR